MLLINEQKTKIQAGDTLAFSFKGNTISIARTGGKIYFSHIIPPTDKKIASFIRSKEDFCDFSTFLGNLFCLSGKPLEDKDSGFDWKFTHGERGSKKICFENTIVSFHKDLKLICFSSKEIKLRLRFSAPFIQNENDLDDLLLIVGAILDFSHRKNKDHESGKILERVIEF